MVELPTDKIRDDGGTQVRFCILDEDVMQYCEEMKRGVCFPPIVVFQDEAGVHWLADGFHRLWAAKELKHTSIECIVKMRFSGSPKWPSGR